MSKNYYNQSRSSPRKSFEDRINDQDKDGNTRLHKAVMRQDYMLVKELLDAGANIHIRNNKKHIPIFSAAFHKKSDILYLMIAYSINTGDNHINQQLMSVIQSQNPMDIKRIVVEINKHPNTFDIFLGELCDLLIREDNFQGFFSLASSGIILATWNKDGKTPLHICAEYKKISFAKVALEFGLRADVIDQHGKNPMHYAAKTHNHAMVELLNDHAENNFYSCDMADSTGTTPLYLTLQSDGNLGKKINIIQFLLNSGADVNNIDAEGRSIMHYAVYYYNEEIFIMLLNIPYIKISLQDKQGLTPLHIASEYKKNTAAKLLLEKDALVNVKDALGNTALHYAAKNLNLKMIKDVILDNCDVINIVNNKGYYPWQYALEAKKVSTMDKNINFQDKDKGGYAHYIVDNNDVNMLEIMCLLSDINLNLQDIAGKTPLHYAVDDESVDMVRALLAKGAEANLSDKEGNNPMHYAAQKYRTEMALMLNQYAIDKGYSFDKKNDLGITPLYLALKFRNKVVIESLLESGCDPNCTIENNLSLIHLLPYQEIEVIKLFLEHYALDFTVKDHKGKNVLHHAAECGNMEAISCLVNYAKEKKYEYLLDQQSNNGFKPWYYALKNTKLIHDIKNINAKDGSGMTLAHNFARIGYDKSLEILKTLSSINLKAKDNDGNTPLHYSAYCNKLEMTKKLLELDDSIKNEKNNFGETPMHMILESFRDAADISKMLQLLLDHGADPTIYDNSGDTVLHRALMLPRKNYDLISMFLESNTSEYVNLQSEAKEKEGEKCGGQTLLFVAAQNGYLKTVKLLLDHGADPNIPDEKGCVPLHVALFAGKKQEVTKLLLLKGANRITEDNMGNSYTSLSKALRDLPKNETEIVPDGWIDQAENFCSKSQIIRKMNNIAGEYAGKEINMDLWVGESDDGFEDLLASNEYFDGVYEEDNGLSNNAILLGAVDAISGVGSWLFGGK